MSGSGLVGLLASSLVERSTLSVAVGLSLRYSVSSSGLSSLWLGGFVTLCSSIGHGSSDVSWDAILPMPLSPPAEMVLSSGIGSCRGKTTLGIVFLWVVYFSPYVLLAPPNVVSSTANGCVEVVGSSFNVVQGIGGH